MPVQGLLRALIVLAATAGAAIFALRKLGIIGDDDPDEAIEYAPADGSADDGEDDAADE